MTRVIDYGPLLREPAPDEVARFRAAAAADAAYAKAGSSATVQTALGAVVALLVISVILGIAAPVVAVAFAINPVVGVAALVIGLTVAGGLIALAIWGIVTVARRADARWPRWLRLDAFARANRMVFSPRTADPAYPGLIYGIGSGRASVDHLRSASDRFLDYGNYTYQTSNGKNTTTHTWGFLALELDRTLPHMLMDAVGNDGLFGSAFAPIIDRKQVLSLEGDFDRWFTLYCPRQYERDALYVFTPDLMALLIDNAAPFDVEIIDRWMLVYSPRAFEMTDPALHDRLMRIVDTVGRKTLTQSDRYVDDRIGSFAPNIVAPPGQRLKRRFPVWAIVLLAVLLGMAGLPVLLMLVGALISIG